MVSLTSLILGALALAAAPAACETTTAGAGVEVATTGGSDCLAGMRTFDCGARYVRGQNLGSARCVKVRGKDVTTTIACALIAMGNAAERESGQPFRVNSGFRTNAHQAQLYRQNCRGRSRCSPATARPGYSNHQSGIAVDISVAAYPRLFQWLADNATRFGFVRSVSTEDWHFDYRPGEKCNARTSQRCSSRRNCRPYSCKSPALEIEAVRTGESTNTGGGGGSSSGKTDSPVGGPCSSTWSNGHCARDCESLADRIWTLTGQDCSSGLVCCKSAPAIAAPASEDGPAVIKCASQWSEGTCEDGECPDGADRIWQPNRISCSGGRVCCKE
eukprot:TRINITY_DN6254_c1_g1_i1.p2 TRINITY_DN6254_c1_g1~~TRINITY_DN6254_c1_g1_i1.p2  ORF type:complete len:369 (-),score=142.52 TRINITY_DN6254_c1_g1_i1:234-1226(-)